MSAIRFERGSEFIEIECGADYPAGRNHQVIQVSDRTSAGVLQVETLGVHIEQRVLSFTLLPLDDYLQLLDWFLNVAVAGENTFDFTDERGRTDTVRFLENALNFRETSYQRYAGSFTLEYV